MLREQLPTHEINDFKARPALGEVLELERKMRKHLIERQLDGEQGTSLRTRVSGSHLSAIREILPPEPQAGLELPDFGIEGHRMGKIPLGSSLQQFRPGFPLLSGLGLGKRLKCLRFQSSIELDIPHWHLGFRVAAATGSVLRRVP